MGFLRKKYFGEVICFDLFVCLFPFLYEILVFLWNTRNADFVMVQHGLGISEMCKMAGHRLLTMHLSDLSYGES